MNLINEASPHFHGKGSARVDHGHGVPVAFAHARGFRVSVRSRRPAARSGVRRHGARDRACVLLPHEPREHRRRSVLRGHCHALRLHAAAHCGYFPAILGTVFAIAVVKMLFGGIGCNFANPAVAARVFIMLAMPIALGAYPEHHGSSARRHHRRHPAGHERRR